MKDNPVQANMWRVIVGATGMLLVLCLSGCSPAKPTATPRPPEEIFLGDVYQKDGYFLSATAIEDPATPAARYVPQAGRHLVAVDVVIGNVSAAPFRVNPLNAALIDQNGTRHFPQLGGREGQLPTLDVCAGERVRGWIAFSLPDESHPVRLTFSRDMAADDFFDVGLTPPPEGHTPIGLTAEMVRSSLPAWGTPAERGNYLLRALTVEDPLAGDVQIPLEAGQKLVGVEAEVGNISWEPIHVSSMYFMAVDTDGFLYPPVISSIGEVDLAVGEKVLCRLIFRLPQTSVLERLKLVPSLVTDSTAQVSLRKQ